MIQTVANVRSDILIPGSSRLPVPADEFRNGFPASSSSGCSSSSVQQGQQRSAPGEQLLYAHDLSRALEKSDFGVSHRRAHLQNPRSRDRVDERHDETMSRVLRHSEHFSNAASRQSDCHPPPTNRQQPPFVNSNSSSQQHKRNDARNPSQGHDGIGGGTLTSDRGDATVAAAAAYPGDDNHEGVDDDDEGEDFVSPPKIAPVGGRILTVGKLFRYFFKHSWSDI